MKILRKITTCFVVVGLFALTSSFVLADKPVLDVVVGSGNTGGTWRTSLIINAALKSMGYDSEMVHTKNCVGTKKYISKNPRPGIVLWTDSKYASDVRKGCKLIPDESTFVTPFSFSNQAMCTLKKHNFTSIENFLKGKKRITVASITSYPNNLYTDLTNQFGIKFVRVDYSGSSKALKGLLAQDTDLLYTEYTKRTISNPDIDCFAVSGDVKGKAVFKDIFPTWSLAKLGQYQYYYGINLTKKQTKDARAALHKIIATDPKIVNAMSVSSMIPGHVLWNRGDRVGTWHTHKELWMK